MYENHLLRKNYKRALTLAVVALSEVCILVLGQTTYLFFQATLLSTLVHSDLKTSYYPSLRQFA